MNYNVSGEIELASTPAKKTSHLFKEITKQQIHHRKKKLSHHISYEDNLLNVIEDRLHNRRYWLIALGILGGLISCVLFFAAFAAGLLTFGASLAWLVLGAIGALLIGFNYFVLSKRIRDINAKIVKRTFLLKQKEFGFQPLEYKFPPTTWREKLYPWLDRLATGLMIAMAFSALYFQPLSIISSSLAYGFIAVFCTILILNKVVSAYFYTQAENDANQLKSLKENQNQYKKECLTVMADDASYNSLSSEYKTLPSLRWQKLFALIMSLILGTITSAIFAALEGATATTGMYLLSIISGVLITGITFYAANHYINKNHAVIKSKIERRFGGTITIDENSDKNREPNSWWQNLYQELFSLNSMGTILLALALVPTKLSAIVGIKADWLALTTINAAILILFIGFQYLQDSFQKKWQQVADNAEKKCYEFLEEKQPQYKATINYTAITPSKTPPRIVTSTSIPTIHILSPTMANNLPSPI